MDEIILNKEQLAYLVQKKKDILHETYIEKVKKHKKKERYNQIMEEILLQADIVCMTLNTAGSDKV